MVKENSDQERRVEKRFNANLPLKIGGVDFKITTDTKNISSSGIYCQVDRFVPVMTKLGLKMSITLIENDQKVKRDVDCQAVVVRVNPESESGDTEFYQLGLFFTDIAEQDRQLINLYLQHAFFAGNN